ncbi:substrate-binding domain-containing protein [Desulfovibrio ferrophilus]|uniref:Sugar-binding protein n=1 Tax=Desulfovibrio ferrophilus TaxID=241368 RepID=A0A2Z6AW99_9BACT|nr:substrate-binding domain-containing protein [Desulfovibrio ferrophilus]BBD07508.1 sugar-binding protein [Desulfovibrio ferrophilus]
MFKLTAPLIIALFIALIFPLPNTATGKTLRFAIIPKTGNSEFYTPVKHGCMNAAEALEDVQCIYRGPERADPRLQNNIISDLIDEGIDGLAVAVINSEFIEERSIAKARKAGIPIVTFDSDFSRATLSNNHDIRKAYIGTDNYQFGQRLGELAKQHRPGGGTYCIISGHKSAPGLADRMRGTINALNRNNSGKWTQYERCPLFCRDDPEVALNQLLYILDDGCMNTGHVDTIIILGAWPQQRPEEYLTSLSKRRADLDSKKIIIIVGDTLQNQLQLLEQGLAHGNIGQKPYAMGKKAIEILYKIYHGEPVPNVIYTPTESCVRRSSSDVICTE